MDSVIRAAVVYVALMLIFRIIGKRSLASITTFDAVLLLIISEAVQEGLIDGDESMTNAFLLVLTLVGIDLVMSLITARWGKAEKFFNDAPLVILDHGRPFKDRMLKERVTEDDILERAREQQGIERLDQIKYAVLERSGGITVIPMQSK